MDHEQVTGSRWKPDVAGHYARYDVFELSVNRQSFSMMRKKNADPKNDGAAFKRTIKK